MITLSFLKRLFPLMGLLLAFGSGYHLRSAMQHKITLEQEREFARQRDNQLAISHHNAVALEQALLEVKEYEQIINANATEPNHGEANHPNAQPRKVSARINKGTEGETRRVAPCDGIDADFIQLFNAQTAGYERILSRSASEHVNALPANASQSRAR